MVNSTIRIPESVLERAKIKAKEEDKAVEQVVRDLLDGWLEGAIHLTAEKHPRKELVALARAAQGMWADRDPDEYLALSRAGLGQRDEELNNARLDA